jgi:hypothetical protein
MIQDPRWEVLAKAGTQCDHKGVTMVQMNECDRGVPSREFPLSAQC